MAQCRLQREEKRMRKVILPVVAMAVWIGALQPALAQQRPGSQDQSKMEEQLKVKLALAVRMLAAEGLIASSGHVSVRLPGTNKILINSNYTSREFLQPRNVVTVTFDDDRKVGGEEP